MVYVPKTYMYHIFRDGNFLGLLDNKHIISDFRYQQQINTGFAQLEIEVGLSIDTSHETLDPLRTEEGIPITTEEGEYIYPEGIPEFVGNNNEQALIRNNNDIKVYEISENYPTGKLVFAGYISRWKARVGGNDTVKVTCLSYGAELNNFIIFTGYTSQITQTTEDATRDMGLGDDSTAAYGQTFTPASSFMLGRIDIYGFTDQGAQTVTLKIYEGGEPFGAYTLLATTTFVVSNTSLDWIEIVLPTPIQLLSGQQYTFEVGDSAQYMKIRSKETTDPYAGGSMWNRALTGVYSQLANSDLAFKIYSATENTESAYTSDDPADILRSVLDDYVSRGGHVTYDGSSIVSAGTSVSYTFKLNTTLEGIKKCLELAPSNYRWWVDPATNLLYFKAVSATADHTMILGQHIEGLDIEATTENIKTDVYFSGGDTGGGVNLFIRLQDNDVLEENNSRPGVSRITDNRVTITATGEAIAQNELDLHDTEEYETTITINDAAYDTNLIDLGDTIGFGGFGNFVDSLILEVVSKTKMPDKVVLGLGVPPKRATAQIEAAQRAIKDLETIDNPATPS